MSDPAILRLLCCLTQSRLGVSATPRREVVFQTQLYWLCCCLRVSTLNGLRCEFKDGAEVVSAASRGRAVEIALRVEDQASQWSGPVLPFTKAVENRFLARWRELKNRTFVVGAAQLGRAVEVTLRLEGQTCGSEVSIRPILIKTMENRLRP